MDLSIIIPVYNVERYLARCLDSVLSQTFNNWEVILINDCTPDGSQKIIDHYVNTDNRIRSIINDVNMGLGGARNVGLKAALGKYLMFLDSDDYISDENVLRKLMKQMQTFKLDILDSRYRVIENNKTKVLLPKFFKELNREIYTGEEYLDSVEILPVVAWNKIYKRSHIEKYNIKFKERKYEDICFTLEAIYKAKSVQNTVVVFYDYIVRPGSIMTSKPNKSSIDDCWCLCKDLELMYHEYNKNHQIEKSFFYSFVSMAGLLNDYNDGSHKTSILMDLKSIHKKYRGSILKAKKLGVIQKILLFISPSFMNYVLRKLKN
jgi:glycosyltransferase involved in cell wall biosynthesis